MHSSWFFWIKPIARLILKHEISGSHTISDQSLLLSTTVLNDSNWELKSYCLQTHYVLQDHTGEVLEETLQQWALKANKLVSITIDSGSNIKLACTLLSWTRLSCFGHNLNLAVEKGLNDRRVQRGLRVCRSAVAAFSRSWKKQRDLVVAQEQ